jgi:hypothetical protein
MVNIAQVDKNIGRPVASAGATAHRTPSPHRDTGPAPGPL